jgi:hypothetical protein
VAVGECGIETLTVESAGLTSSILLLVLVLGAWIFVVSRIPGVRASSVTVFTVRRIATVRVLRIAMVLIPLIGVVVPWPTIGIVFSLKVVVIMISGIGIGLELGVGVILTPKVALVLILRIQVALRRESGVVVFSVRESSIPQFAHYLSLLSEVFFQPVDCCG